MQMPLQATFYTVDTQRTLNSNFIKAKHKWSLIPDTAAFPVTGVDVVTREATLTTAEVAALLTTDEADWVWFIQTWCCCPDVFAAGAPEDDELEPALSICCIRKKAVMFLLISQMIQQ